MQIEGYDWFNLAKLFILSLKKVAFAGVEDCLPYDIKYSDVTQGLLGL